jgi:hypothetical protein
VSVAGPKPAVASPEGIAMGYLDHGRAQSFAWRRTVPLDRFVIYVNHDQAQ